MFICKQAQYYVLCLFCLIDCQIIIKLKQGNILLLCVKITIKKAVLSLYI